MTDDTGLKARLKGVAHKAYAKIKEKSSKVFKIEAIKGVIKKIRAKEQQQDDADTASHVDDSNNAPDSQSGSLLYRIPQEIRDEIFRCFFASTPIEFATRPASENGRNPLALLACCRRMRNEIGPLWMEDIELHFGSPETMIRKLLTFPGPLSSVRHVTVSGLMGSMVAVRTTTRPQAEVLLHEFLRVLESMRLEELIVHANLGCLYFERLAAELLITRSNGWRRLAVSFQRSHLLDMSAYLNQPDCYDFARRYNLTDHRLSLMPEQFLQALQYRDGPQTLPSVRLEQNSELPYPDLTAPGTVHAHHSLHSPYCRNRHPLPHVDFVWRKPLWVRAERGRGVDYAVPPLREDASEDRPYLQTKEKILEESSGSGLRHRVVKCDYRSLQYGWDDELHSAGRARR